MKKTKEQNQKKCLLLIVPSLHQGGYERMCVETARIMQEVCRVTLMVFTLEDAHYDVSGLDVVNIDLPARKGKIGKAFNLFRRARAIRRYKKKHGIDVTYSFGATANLANVYGRASDFTVTGIRSSMDFDMPDRLRRVTQKSDLIISCSRLLQNKLKTEYDCRQTALLYNPIDMERIRRLSEEPSAAPKKDTKTLTIVTMGRDDAVKGYWHLIKAVSQVRKTIPDVRLMIIGSGSFDSEKKLVQDLGMEEAVLFTGVQKNPFPYLKSGDLYVLSSNREGFPNSALEAMALGLPVIACDCVSGPRELLLTDEEQSALTERFGEETSTKDAIDGAYGVLIPDMDATPDYDAAKITPDDRMLETAIRRMTDNAELGAHYAEQSRQRAAQFSREKYRKTLAELLRIDII